VIKVCELLLRGSPQGFLGGCDEAGVFLGVHRGIILYEEITKEVTSKIVVE